ncbi:DUF3077 domain-containing protein [Thiocystis violascens]|uniref:Uncharacterized protein n=1 Tax=Thiocystis violascens (strain ATCC 17096 / DSM 198 / 6111) TaxID=765911 RepID=I3Y9A9_THIV6|nr:DUF3077 domain-containing protein [Thiocystis violascens]AFL73577.1 hypothetical protein Thivi_1589 [Thiocystis violascens DSM 198]
MKTERTPFSACGPDAYVFEVRPSVPVDDALELASAMMDAAIQSLMDAGSGLGLHPESSRLYTAIYTLEQAHALVNAAVPAVLGCCGDDKPRLLTLELSDHEARIAAKEGRDLSRTAASLLAGAIRRHAPAVSGGAA